MLFNGNSKSMPNYSQNLKNLKLQSRLYKIKVFSIFLLNNLHISKKSSTFAPDLKINIINNLKFINYERILCNIFWRCLRYRRSRRIVFCKVSKRT